MKGFTVSKDLLSTLSQRYPVVFDSSFQKVIDEYIERQIGDEALRIGMVLGQCCAATPDPAHIRRVEVVYYGDIDHPQWGIASRLPGPLDLLVEDYERTYGTISQAEMDALEQQWLT